MWVAAFETSTRAVAVALFDTVRGVARESLVESEGERGRALLDRLESLIVDAGLAREAIGMLACSIGPGSYTGVRIGVTLARSMALAGDLPLKGVGSLEVAAMSPIGVASGAVDVSASARANSTDQDFSSQPLAVIANAFRGEVIVACYSACVDGARERIMDARLFAPAEAAATIARVASVAIGDGAEAHAAVFASAGIRVVAGARPSAATLALLAWRAFERDGPDDPMTVAPVHLRRADEEFRTL